jgi:DNA (cytosine-5)-methyltransferase 1
MLKTFIDLFSGAGGMSCGLEMAGLKCLLGIDHDRNAFETFKHNHPHADVILGDISKISTPKIRESIRNQKIDIVCGGPPCQGFSTIGQNNQKDLRNFLFLEFVRIVKDLTPDYIILENVTGILSRKNENTFNNIFNCFAEIGYSIDVRVLSAHHFGVASKRRRAIIIGNKFGLSNIYPEQLFKDSCETINDLPLSRTVGWAFKNLIYFNDKIYNHDLEKAKISNQLEEKRLNYIPEGKSIRYEKDQLAYLPKELWFDVNWQDLHEQRFREAKLNRLDRNSCANTINTSKTTYYHPVENRYLTAREAAAIQSFPSNYIFYGTVAQQWKQIGNAVPPLLAKAIGLAIIESDKCRDLLSKQHHNFNIDKVRATAFSYKNRSTSQGIQLKLFEN